MVRNLLHLIGAGAPSIIIADDVDDDERHAQSPLTRRASLEDTAALDRAENGDLWFFVAFGTRMLEAAALCVAIVTRPGRYYHGPPRCAYVSATCHSLARSLARSKAARALAPTVSLAATYHRR